MARRFQKRASGVNEPQSIVSLPEWLNSMVMRTRASLERRWPGRRRGDESVERET